MHKPIARLGFLALTAALLAGTVHADPPAVGEPAPAFRLVDGKGVEHTLATYKGKRGVVLAWFPAAFTPG